MTYRVFVTPAAGREFRKLPRDVQVRLGAELRGLADDPRLAGYAQLSGSSTLYRVRSGDYRIIYAVDDGDLFVTVVKVAHRRDVYRDL